MQVKNNITLLHIKTSLKVSFISMPSDTVFKLRHLLFPKLGAFADVSQDLGRVLFNCILNMHFL